MSNTFRVKRGESSLQADFVEPSFQFLEDTSGLLRSLHSGLSSFGLALSEMKVEVGSRSMNEASPGDWALVCYLYSVSTTVRVRVDRMEIRASEVVRVDPATLGSVATAALKAIVSFLGGLPFRAYSWGLGLHGTLDGVAPKDFLSQFTTNAPSRLGALLGAATIFYFGDSTELASSVTVDLSGLVDNGLFVRNYLTWDASKVELEAIPAKAIEFRDLVFAELGLTLSE